ncbi:hypothetical protein MMC25_000887 [Agyrium rufum]|nr:hypothetical protein [Agyrium rufum]
MATRTNLAFRDADPSEDDELARVFYNAFLPIWNRNWFQCLDKLLDPIPSGTSSPLSPLQARRLAFYRSWIAFNRAHNDDVMVAYTPSSTSTPTSDEPSSSSPSSPPDTAPAPFTPTIAAVCLLLPPHARPTWFEPVTAWRTGLFPGLIGLSLRGLYRVCFVYEESVGRMIGRALRDRGVEGGEEGRLLFCNGCVRNPEWEGRAPARRLLDWGIRRRWEGQRVEGDGKGDGSGKGKGTGNGKMLPVWLDISIDEAVRAYEEIGFEVVGECMVETGADEKGIKLTSDAGSSEREKGRRMAKVRVMLRMPPEV